MRTLNQKKVEMPIEIERSSFLPESPSDHLKDSSYHLKDPFDQPRDSSDHSRVFLTGPHHFAALPVGKEKKTEARRQFLHMEHEEA